MTQKKTVALIYDFDGTLSPGNMQEYDFIPAVGKSNREFWSDANVLAETQDADPVLAYMARMIQEAQSKGLSLRREAFQESGRNVRYFDGVKEWFSRMNRYAEERLRGTFITAKPPRGAAPMITRLPSLSIAAPVLAVYAAQLAPPSS